MDHSKILVTLIFISNCISTTFTKDKIIGISSEGDLILGGLFPVHNKGTGNSKCGSINSERGIQRLEAMRFAVQKINLDDEILKGVKLGVKILDTCSDETHALDQSLDFVMSSLATSQDYCDSDTTQSADPDHIVAVVGAAYSSVSIQVANLLRLFEIPQISYASTSVALSNRDRFGYFMRTVPPDKLQANALVDIVQYFNWTYVATVASEGLYGEKGIESFHDQFLKAGQCISAHERISDESDYEKVVRNLHSKKARVVILFVRQDHVSKILRAAQDYGYIDDFIWLASDGWGSSNDPVMGLEETAAGALTITLQSQPIADFDDYFRRLTPSNNKANIWFSEHVKELESECENNSVVRRDSVATSFVTTKAPQNISATPNTCKYQQESKVQFVVDAVYAVAYGLDRLYHEHCGLEAEELCEKFKTNTSIRSQLLDYITQNRRDDPYGNAIRFDQNGDSLGYYNIMNYRNDPETGSYEYAIVGSWKDGHLSIESNNIVWSGLQKPTQPRSICSLPCEAGEYKSETAESECCWKCIPCNAHEYLKDEHQCEACTKGYWPNHNKTECVKLKLHYMKWSSPYALIPAMLSLLGLICTIIVMSVFIKHRATPVVKAAGRELSFMLFTGCIVCYIAAFIVLLKPSLLSCVAQRLTVGLGFSMIYSALLTKTMRIYRIFNSARRTTQRPTCISPKSQLVIASLQVSVQIVLFIVWIFIEPPETDEAIPDENKRDYVVLKCKNNDYSVPIFLSYNMLLIIICTIFAVMTRKIPSSFNESKFIGFTMYTTCIVWLSFVPLFFGLKQLHEVQTTTLCTAIVLSATVALICLFGPKIYIIILHPEKNRRRTTKERSRFSCTTRGGFKTDYDDTEYDSLKRDQDCKKSKVVISGNGNGVPNQEGKLLLNDKEASTSDDKDHSVERTSSNTNAGIEHFPIDHTPDDSGQSGHKMSCHSDDEESFKGFANGNTSLSQDSIGIDNLKRIPNAPTNYHFNPLELASKWKYIDNANSSGISSPTSPVCISGGGISISCTEMLPETN